MIDVSYVFVCIPMFRHSVCKILQTSYQLQLDCLPLTPKKLVTSYPEGLTACPAPSCKRALATGFNNWSVQRSTGNNHKQPIPLRRHLSCLCSQRTVPWHWQTRDWQSRGTKKQIHSSKNNAWRRRWSPTIQLPNWGLSVTCESILLRQLDFADFA